jgi:hypothetical protein
MIRVAITEPAFEAIPATLPLGSVGVEPQVDAKGDRYCDVILRLIETAGHDA